MYLDDEQKTLVRQMLAGDEDAQRELEKQMEQLAQSAHRGSRDADIELLALQLEIAEQKLALLTGVGT